MIRLLTPKDASQVRALRLKSLKTDKDAFISTFEYESQFDVDYFSRKIIFNTQEPIFGYWGIFEQEQLLGYVQLVRERLPKAQHVVSVYELYVLPEKRHSGLGRELMTHILQISREHPEIEQIHLEVSSNNILATQLYLSLGFEITGTTKNAIKFHNNYQDEIRLLYQCT